MTNKLPFALAISISISLYAGSYKPKPPSEIEKANAESLVKKVAESWTKRGRDLERMGVSVVPTEGTLRAELDRYAKENGTYPENVELFLRKEAENRVRVALAAKGINKTKKVGLDDYKNADKSLIDKVKTSSENNPMVDSYVSQMEAMLTTIHSEAQREGILFDVELYKSSLEAVVKKLYEIKDPELLKTIFEKIISPTLRLKGVQAFSGIQSVLMEAKNVIELAEDIKVYGRITEVVSKTFQEVVTKVAREKGMSGKNLEHSLNELLSSSLLTSAEKDRISNELFESMTEKFTKLSEVLYEEVNQKKMTTKEKKDRQEEIKELLCKMARGKCPPFDFSLGIATGRVCGLRKATKGSTDLNPVTPPLLQGTH